MLSDELFAFEFCASIHAVGACRVGLGVGRVLRSVEHIVGGNLHHPASTFAHCGCQITRRCGVESVAQGLVAFGFIYRSVGGAVYDAIDIVRIYECVDGIFVGNVKFIHISVEENVLAVSFLQQLDFVSKLAVAAGYQNVHVV